MFTTRGMSISYETGYSTNSSSMCLEETGSSWSDADSLRHYQTARVAGLPFTNSEANNPLFTWASASQTLIIKRRSEIVLWREPQAGAVVWQYVTLRADITWGRSLHPEYCRRGAGMKIFISHSSIDKASG